MDKILIVDDNTFMQRRLSEILDRDYDVYTVTDAENAVAMSMVIKPSLILLDIIMPKISGFEVIKELKREKETANIPVIFLTALNSEGDEERGLTLGAVDYITKPFREGIVRARVKTHVNLYNNKSLLDKEQEYNRTIFGLTEDTIFDYDIGSDSIQVSKNFSKRFKIPDVLKNFSTSITSCNLVAKESMGKLLEMVEGARDGSNARTGAELQLQLPDSSLVWYVVHYSILMDANNRPQKVIGKMNDITYQKKRLDELTLRAETDPLTKLFNKEECKKRIEQCLESSPVGEHFAMLIIDIDDFKGVNDNLGHQSGDAVLEDIGGKIKRLFRDSDIVGRIGGDEFMVFMRNISNISVAVEKATELCEEFRYTYTGENNDYQISGSVGIAFYPQHGKTYGELYHMADIALYQSKHRGKNRYTIYNAEMKNISVSEIAPIEEKGRLVSNYFADDLFYSIFQMLYETNDTEATVNMILSIIGKKYKTDRVYIFLHDKQDRVSNVFTWHKLDIAPLGEAYKNIPAEELKPLYSAFSEDGVFYQNDIPSSDAEVYGFLKNQGVKSVLICSLLDKHQIKGFIGFDQCTRKRIWSSEEIASLSYISRILSVFMLKNNT